MPDESSPDDELKRWLEQQDPFGSAETKRQLEEFRRHRELRLEHQKTARSPVFGLFGAALIPFAVWALGIVAAAVFLAWAIRTMP